MKTYPAIALIEFSNISTGIEAGDAMIKKAPISMLKAGTVSRGNYLVLIGGSVASVEESFKEGLTVGAEGVIDKVLLPDVHQQVLQAIAGAKKRVQLEALGVIETASVAATIEASDAAIKGATINIVEIRLADSLGGKGFVIVNGKVEDVEAAVEIGVNAISNKALWRNSTIIPAIHTEMAKEIDGATRFSAAEFRKLPGEEF